ncbi:MAG: hypothetical protein JWQ70_1034 [Aeromicrobium sp.]|jgi:hypothetical protein|nr:hypothetical protein [Aeromicrobium sp.]
MTATTAQLDELARSVHSLVVDTAAHQVSREIAHLAEITVDSDDTHLTPPTGYRTPSGGAATTHVVARSWDIPEASVETQVSVWVTGPQSSVPGLLITRIDYERVLEIDIDEVSPEPTPHLRGQVNDFVAVSIAHMVSSLNVAMQRTHIREV